MTVLDIAAEGVKGDGTPADTARFQAVIDANIGATLLIACGRAVVSGPLKIPAFTHLRVDGTLQLAPGSNFSLLSLMGGSGVRIDGRGVLDGNRAAQHLIVDGPPPYSACILAPGRLDPDAQPIDGLVVEGLVLVNAFHWPLSLSRTSRARIRDVAGLSSGNSFQFTEGCDDCSAEGLRIAAIDDDGFAFYGGVTNSRLHNSVVSGCPAGWVALNDSGSPSPCVACSVTGSIFGANKVGGAVQTGAGGAGAHEDILSSGNQYYGNPSGGLIWQSCGNGKSADLFGPGNTAGDCIVEGGCNVRVV